MVAQETVDGRTREGSLVKSAGQPYAGNPHVRLEEGAPVGTPCEDTQAPPTERGGNSYGLAKAQPNRALLYNPGAAARLVPERYVTVGAPRTILGTLSLFVD